MPDNINDFESCPTNLLDERVTILPAFKASCYAVAGISANALHKYGEANMFMEKVVALDGNPINRYNLALSFANLSVQQCLAKDFKGALNDSESAISNIDEIGTNVWLIANSNDLNRVYAQAATIAFLNGDTTKAANFAEKMHGAITTSSH